MCVYALPVNSIVLKKRTKYQSIQTFTYVFSFSYKSKLFFRQNFRRSFLFVALVFVNLDFVGRRQVVGTLDRTRLRHRYVTLRRRCASLQHLKTRSCALHDTGLDWSGMLCTLHPQLPALSVMRRHVSPTPTGMLESNYWRRLDFTNSTHA